MFTYSLGSLTQMMAMTNYYPENPEEKASMNLAFTIHLQGKLDIPKLERAIDKLTKEKIMHTYLSVEGNQFLAHEKEYVPFKLETEKAEGSSEEEKKATVKAIAEKKALEPLPIFDADKNQFYFRLYELSEEYHILLMIVHHTFLDFGAVMIAIGHIFSYYNDENYIYEKSDEFSSFMKEELDFMASDGAKAEEKFWAEETANVIQPALVPNMLTENDAPLEEKDVMAAFSRKDLDAIAVRERTSTFNLLMLLVHMAIAKVNDCNDTFLQYAISNRSEVNYRFTLGCLTRVLFNRINFDDDMNVSELNKILRKKVGAGYQNRHVAGKTPFGAASYIAVNEDMGDLNVFPSFNGKPLQFDFVDLPRELNFIAFLMLPLDADTIGVGALTDMLKYGKHAKQLIDALNLAQQFITKYPDKTSGDFMRKDITLELLS